MNKRTQRLRIHENLDRDYPEPRKLDVTNEADNALMYKYYTKFSEVAKKFKSDEDLMNAFIHGEIHNEMKIHWPHLKIVNHIQ